MNIKYNYPKNDSLGGFEYGTPIGQFKLEAARKRCPLD
jgi:hypothetical protein